MRQEAEAAIAAAGLGDRCEFVGGSFFDSVPKGGDVYVLLQILHDWSDEHATRILHTCREAIAREGRLVVLDLVVPDGPEQRAPTWLDLQMLVLLGGRERTEEEWRQLLADGGFQVERITTAARASVIEARPV